MKIRVFCILSALVLLTVFSACKSTETVDFSNSSISSNDDSPLYEDDSAVIYASSAPFEPASITFENVNGEVLMDGNGIQEVLFKYDKANSEYVVQLNFTDSGRDKFAKITEDNIGYNLSICVDGTVISSPLVYAKITDGQAVIGGANTYEQAEDMYNLLTQ